MYYVTGSQSQFGHHWAWLTIWMKYYETDTHLGIFEQWCAMGCASTEKVWQDRNKLQSGNVWHPQTKVDGLESEKDRIRIRFQLGLVWFPEFNVCCHENHLIRDVTDLKRRFVAFTVPVAKPIIKLCPANYVFDGNLPFEDCFVAGLTAQEDSFRYSLLFRRRLP